MAKMSKSQARKRLVEARGKIEKILIADLDMSNQRYATLNKMRAELNNIIRALK